MMLIASIAWSGIIHVPADQPTIQAGIDAAVDGDTVLVADGIYTGEGNVNLDFKGKTITVKSEGGAENCVIDCENKPGTRGFYFHNFEGPDSILDGFTIQNGNVSNGGGIYCYDSDPTIMNNIITGNSVSGQGGGIHCQYLAEVRIINNIIVGNSAGQGGGISCQNASPTMMNNTIVGNSAGEGGGLYGYYSGPKITNTIIWDNNPQQIYLFHVTLTVSYSDVEGGQGGIGGVPDDIFWENNIDADPLFVDPGNDDYHLQAGSPCIDTGTPDGAPPDDIEGNPRDEFPDMGAYEYVVGTGSINGRVTDMEGNPIKWAFVIAINADTKDKYKAFTDGNGDYEIPDLPPGTYWVICIKKDYKAGIRKAEVVAGEETTVDFRLKPKSD